MGSSRLSRPTETLSECVACDSAAWPGSRFGLGTGTTAPWAHDPDEDENGDGDGDDDDDAINQAVRGTSTHVGVRQDVLDQISQLKTLHKDHDSVMYGPGGYYDQADEALRNAYKSGAKYR